MKLPAFRIRPRRILYSLLAVFIMLCTVIALVAGTQSGSRWVIRQIVNKSNQSLGLSSVNGTLLTGLSIQNFRYNDPETEVTLETADFRWYPLSLLAGRFSIDSLRAEGLRYEYRSGSAQQPDQTNSAFSMPLTLSINEADIHDIRIRINGGRYQLDAASISGDLDSDALSLDQFTVVKGALSVRVVGSMAVQSPYVLQAAVDWKYLPDDTSRFEGSLRVQGSPDHITLEHELIQPLAVTTKGEIKFGDAPYAKLSSISNSIRWPFDAERLLITSDNTVAVLEGWLNDYKVSATSEFNSVNLPRTRLKIDALGNLEMLQITSLTANSKDDRLNAQGHGKILFDPVSMVDANFQVSLGVNRLTLKGKMGNTADLTWRVSAPRLKDILPQLAGSIEGNGRVKGKWPGLSLSGNLTGNQIAYQNYSLNSARIRASALATDLQSQIDVSAKELNLAGEAIEKIDLKIKGSPQHHHVDVAANNSSVAFTGILEGGYNDGNWDTKLIKSEFTANQFGRWELNAPVAMRVSRDDVNIETACWRRNPANLCLHGCWNRQVDINAGAVLEDFPLEIFNNRLPHGSRLQGLLGAQLTVSGSLPRLQTRLNAAAPNGAILTETETEQTIRYAWRDLSLRVVGDRDYWRINTALDLQQPGYIKGDLTVNAQHELTGQINAELDSIAWLVVFVPQLNDLDGRLILDSRIGGTVESPRYEVTAGLHHGQAGVPAFGLAFNDIELEADSTSRKEISLKGSARSGKGKLDLTGRLTDPVLDTQQLELKVTGEGVETVNLQQAYVVASPDLLIKLKRHRLDLTGSVRVPKAEVKISSPPVSAVTVSDDAVSIDSAGEVIGQSKGGIDVYNDIRLQLDNDVNFQGYGFESRVTGALDIKEEPGKPTQAYGELMVIEGRYKAYGQQLNVEQGRLTFRGPYDNPALAIRAVRVTSDATVGLEIGGTLKKPRSRLFSTPSLPESEIMAILLTGRPMADASEKDANALYNAVLLLGIERGANIANQISTKFGLDVVTVGSDSTTNQNSLLLGKYLTPRLYVRYAIGLFDQTSSFGLEYKLSKNLKLEAKTGQEQSMDLMYKIER